MATCLSCGREAGAGSELCADCYSKASTQSANPGYQSAPPNQPIYQPAPSYQPTPAPQHMQANINESYARNYRYLSGAKPSYISVIICWIIGPILLLVGIMLANTRPSMPASYYWNFSNVQQTNNPLSTVSVICIILGVGLIIVGALLLNAIIKKTKRETVYGYELDNFCDAKTANIMSEAMEKLGLDEEDVTESEPIVVQGYNLLKAGLWYRWWDPWDGMSRSSEYQVSLFFFSKEQVHSFVRTFSLIGNEQFDSTDEYFYRDIVSVSTSQEQAGGGIADCFTLTTSGGTSIRASFKKSDADNINRSISAMRNLLKSKKQAMT